MYVTATVWLVGVRPGGGELMHETSSRLLAEGVETQAELEVMRDMGVHKVQGYLLGAAGSVACLRLSLQVFVMLGISLPHGRLC